MEVAVALGIGVDASAGLELAAVAAVNAVGTVGLAIGLSVGACENKLP